ncbi:type I 3-dehydroquinase-domain-containing protein [Dactylonectria estremocensis]|uniref:Type I 3-dehydroquinase-domain-containing protein n=1 Tax=Dactylonectria estremocensis TaxID=1079267 RepID=A0A9P9JAD1_9HYPO|nr:type I 3-dehydroquinase-domain-containing protein [Dactylonectria estremocensis]
MAGVKRPLGAMLGHEDVLSRTPPPPLSHSHTHSHSRSHSQSHSQISSRSSSISSNSQSHQQPVITLTPPRGPSGVSRPEPHDALTRPSSPTLPPLTGEVPDFSSDASMLFAGVRGAGKSTLAIMASQAMNRKVVDLETAFQRTLGFSSAGYKAKHGSLECYKQQARILQSALDRHRTGCILVCSWMESRVQSLLREFAATNPVIHVVRDANAIQQHLRINDTSKIRNLLNVSSAIFRTCTNFEFFNGSEKLAALPENPSARLSLLQRTPTPYLTLKYVERHLLKFLSLIYPSGTIPFIESAFPLARIPTEERQFTYAMSVPLTDVLNESVDIEEHVMGADVIQIVVHDLAEHLENHTDSKGPTNELSAKLAGDITRGIGRVRRSTILPIILHIFLPQTAGEEGVRAYLDLIHHAVRLAPEMMTVDLRLDDPYISQILVARKRTKIIGNCFLVTDPPPWESSAWVSFYNKANRLGCHLARLIRPASCIEDNFSIAHLRCAVAAMEGPKIPLIAYNSGPLGRNSASFNSILTVVRPESLARVNPKPPIMPCVTARGATEALFSSFIYDEMKLYVFGANVDYSLSPAMHTSALKACGIPHRYQPFSSATLRGIKHLLEDPNFGGASVGLPFKVEVITLTHTLSSHARAIGAVNTLIPIRHLNPDGSVPLGAGFFYGSNRAGPIKALYGENTDWVGIRACIRRGLSPANAVGPSSCGVVIGAGGMARASVYALLQIGMKNVVIHNRTIQNAENMVSHFTQLLQKKDFKLFSSGAEPARFHVIKSLDEAWPEDFRLPTVIVSCIPTHRIGDVPAPDFTVPEPWLGSRTGGVVIELAYKTLNTPLLAQVRRESARGWVAMDGLDLLPEQGFAQFELFTGRRAPRRLMRREVFYAYPDEEGGSSNREELQPRLQLLDEQEA